MAYDSHRRGLVKHFFRSLYFSYSLAIDALHVWIALRQHHPKIRVLFAINAQRPRSGHSCNWAQNTAAPWKHDTKTVDKNFHANAVKSCYLSYWLKKQHGRHSNCQRLNIELLDIRIDRARIYHFTHELIVLAIKGVETDVKREPKKP